jgi:hypothetical protein
MAASVALYARPEIVRKEQCAEAPAGRRSVTYDGLVAAAASPRQGRLLRSCPGADRPTRRLPGGASGRCSGRGASPWSGGRDVRRTVRCRSLSTMGVHPVRFLVRSGVQPSGVQPSGVQPSGVRPSGVRSPGSVVQDRPVRPSGAARPAVSCLVSARPSCGVCPVPGQPAVTLGSTPSDGGLHGWSGSGSVWPAGCPSGSVDGCGGLDAGDAAEVVGRPRGACRSRVAGRVGESGVTALAGRCEFGHRSA